MTIHGSPSNPSLANKGGETKHQAILGAFLKAQEIHKAIAEGIPVLVVVVVVVNFATMKPQKAKEGNARSWT